jgi:alkanesulfonate monooxygenase SsuD/methylene tetrahydromethanopterin reductase-like flavin-dependent oxidoreductase (luciferase family)
VAGTPETVTAWLAAQIAATGSNYLVGQFAFGDLSPAEALASIELFAREVMPVLAGG